MTTELLAILVILTLATYGTTDLLTVQIGPFRIFKRWRGYLRRNKPDIDEENESQEDWELYDRLYDAWERSPAGQLYELFTCPYCLGFWLAGVFTVAYTGIGWYSVAYWLAVYGLHSAIIKAVK